MESPGQVLFGESIKLNWVNHLARFHQQVPPVGAAVHLNLKFSIQSLKFFKVIPCIVDGWRLWFARRRFWLSRFFSWRLFSRRLLPRWLLPWRLFPLRRLFPLWRLWLPCAFRDENQGEEEEKQERESHRELVRATELLLEWWAH